MKPVVMHALAERELREAYRFYDEAREGLGESFLADFRRTVARIEGFPAAPAPVDDQATRKVRLRRFPYTIYYVELPKTIWIVAVAHQKRRPRYWSQRIDDPPNP